MNKWLQYRAKNRGIFCEYLQLTNEVNEGWSWLLGFKLIGEDKFG